MTKQKKESFFWTSYSDLMTSLFFVMLVLFVLTIALLHNKIREQGHIIDEYQKIEEIKRSLNGISKEYFEYNKEYKKHILKLRVGYPTAAYDIYSITDESLLPKILEAGRVIADTIRSFTNDDNIKYLVIIEGQASRSPYINPDDYRNNHVLSYLRAWKLKEYWESEGIDLNRLPNCELVVAGSGEEGVPREQVDSLNQRFLIHIIPKTGEIEKNEKKEKI
ncbi:MAG: flagellar motor protein MotB [Tannerellaceae bacterium]|jgi:hypothetical protein|nr:flagellar motor protein MotB [Tannerellaceae bacterium]